MCIANWRSAEQECVARVRRQYLELVVADAIYRRAVARVRSLIAAIKRAVIRFSTRRIANCGLP